MHIVSNLFTRLQIMLYYFKSKEQKLYIKNEGRYEMGFNRTKFYSNEFTLLDVKPLNIIINNNNIPSGYCKKSGVWTIEIYNKTTDRYEIQEVCETNNMGKEMISGIKCIKKGCENKLNTDEELKKTYKSRVYRYKKYRDIAKKIDENNKIIFRIIALDIPNKKERWAVEAQYAHDTKAIYWHTAPGQSLQYAFYDSIIKRKSNLEVKI